MVGLALTLIASTVVVWFVMMFVTDDGLDKVLVTFVSCFCFVVVALAAASAASGDLATVLVGNDHRYRIVEMYGPTITEEASTVVLHLEDERGNIDFYEFDTARLRDDAAALPEGCFSLISPGDRGYEYGLIPVTFPCEEVFPERENG